MVIGLEHMVLIKRIDLQLESMLEQMKDIYAPAEKGAPAKAPKAKKAA